MSDDYQLSKIYIVNRWFCFVAIAFIILNFMPSSKICRPDMVKLIIFLTLVIIFLDMYFPAFVISQKIENDS